MVKQWSDVNILVDVCLVMVKMVLGTIGFQVFVIVIVVVQRKPLAKVSLQWIYETVTNKEKKRNKD